MKSTLVLSFFLTAGVVSGFQQLRPSVSVQHKVYPQWGLRMSEEETTSSVDPMEEAMLEMDDAERIQMEKAKRADALRAQEVFMKKSTGKHQCNNCDWLYDQEKGDSNMIGGMIKAGTKFDALPNDWRCPVCRASKDSFFEVVEEIPGFEVNQGYGFGTNSWTAGQKNLAVFGALGLFFAIFIGGYALS
jgi:rubredoxin